MGNVRLLPLAAGQNQDWPVTQPASSDAKNTAAPAMSGGLGDAAQRRVRLDVLTEVAFGEAGGMEHL